MVRALSKIPTLTEFLAWEDSQPERHELQDGVVKLMTGGTIDHARICRNLVLTLHVRLRGSGCETLTSDLKVAADERNVFYPDATVVCGHNDAHATHTKSPVLVAEVTSPSSVSRDHVRKGDAYRRVATLQYYLIVSHSEPSVVLWKRGDDTWTDAVITRASGGDIDLPGIGISISLDDIYEGTSLAAPRV